MLIVQVLAAPWLVGMVSVGHDDNTKRIQVTTTDVVALGNFWRRRWVFRARESICRHMCVCAGIIQHSLLGKIRHEDSLHCLDDGGCNSSCCG